MSHYLLGNNFWRQENNEANVNFIKSGIGRPMGAPKDLKNIKDILNSIGICLILYLNEFKLF